MCPPCHVPGGSPVSCVGYSYLRVLVSCYLGDQISTNSVVLKILLVLSTG